MATRRIIIDPTQPAGMTSEQRRTELARIFAAGVIRHIEQRHCAAVPMPKNPSDSGESRLEVPPDPRPYGPVVNALRERERKENAWR